MRKSYLTGCFVGDVGDAEGAREGLNVGLKEGGVLGCVEEN